MDEKLEALTMLSTPLSTPFGKVTLPRPELPTLPNVKAFQGLDERQKKAFFQALGADLSQVFGFIPVVGGILQDIVNDLHAGAISKLLTPGELTALIERTKVRPETMAMMETFLRKK